ADTQEALISGYVALAQTLNLPEQKEQDQTIIVQAVLRWLSTHPGWLLILDNADNLAVLEGLLPSKHLGHLLLTTRSQALGPLADPLEVTTMPRDVGATLLLRRARLIALADPLEAASPADVAIARAIAQELGGLPLALDQAGAYIEETRCGMAHYQKLYHLQPSPLLKRRGSTKHDYPASVATTWSLSFKNVEQQDPIAAELLRCCAFVHPDTIPVELFTVGVVHLGTTLRQIRVDPLVFDDAIRILLAYSLIHRDPATATLSVHRLVQAVLTDAMPTKTKKLWRKRVIQAVNEAFPAVTFEEWTRCGRLLPHVQICTAQIEHEPIPILAAAAHALHKAGTYLRERGQYSSAEPLLVRARAIYEQHFGSQHLETAKILHNLALLYERQGKYEQAESLHQRAIAIQEQCLGVEHPDTAKSLNDLAIICWQLSKYDEAESLFQRALAIREHHLGAEHPDIARTLNGLANLYLWLGKYELAEPLYQRALAIREHHLGADHPDTAQILNNLAIFYRDQGKYEQAEPLFRRALAIREHHLGAEHPDTAGSLEDLAILYQRQEKYQEAELLCQQALVIREQCLGADHPNTARNMNNLAELYRHQHKYELAEPLHQRALAIWERHLGAEHPDTAEALYGLAELYRQQGKYDQAEAFYQRAIAIREQRLGPTHPETQNTRKSYALLLRTAGRDF
ncbi:MAG: tetratricopeptide repeat protein, partial [Chloroflexi bacterium]